MVSGVAYGIAGAGVVYNTSINTVTNPVVRNDANFSVGTFRINSASN
jgi:predicted NodU family carbamoyl transferase